MRRNHLLLSLSLAVAGGGCLMAGNYHSAKTLEKGESQLGVTISSTRYETTTVDSSTGETKTDAVVIPNIIPEITYHIGMADNLEVGGRAGLGSLSLEGDVKWRFYKSDKLHLAIAPAISYQSLLFIEGFGVRLPGILTYELADNVDVTAALFASSTRYSSADPDDTDEDTAIFGGSLVSTGGAIGIDLHGETFSIRPAVEFTRYVARLDDSDSGDDFSTVNFLVHLAFTMGKEKKQLDRIERKLDERLPPPPPPAPYVEPVPPPPPPPPPT